MYSIQEPISLRVVRPRIARATLFSALALLLCRSPNAREVLSHSLATHTPCCRIARIDFYTLQGYVQICYAQYMGDIIIKQLLTRFL